MDEQVQKELEALKGMVLNWKRSYLSWAPPEGGGEYEFLVREFSEEIQMNVYPYVRRMCECNHLTDSEAQEFLNYCYSEVQVLQDALEEPEDQEKKGFWHMLAKD